MNEKLIKILSLILVVLYSVLVAYLMTKDYPSIVYVSFLFLLAYVWYKEIRLLLV